MRVKVKLFATLVRFIPHLKAGMHFEVDLPDRATLADLIGQLNLPQSEIKVTFVNGRSAGLDFRLHTDDEVGIFPSIGGG